VKGQGFPQAKIHRKRPPAFPLATLPILTETFYLALSRKKTETGFFNRRARFHEETPREGSATPKGKKKPFLRPLVRCG